MAENANRFSVMNKALFVAPERAFYCFYYKSKVAHALRHIVILNRQAKPHSG